MPDYGHVLRFGTFITPVNAPIDQAVRLAVRSEELGFDLVTFQDHPYQPSFHDTWTLMTWIAARTEHIRISGNVLNLPLRPPAVLARAAASLERLSGGRFALGLGAGGFWEAIGAMGGRRLTPGEGVDALSEAIDVIRAIWDTSHRGILRAGGEWYSLDGAKPGPPLTSEVPIWVGAYKPRMLRLVGRKADGWLPSLSYLSGSLADGNREIDAAAKKAGRDPREITRLLNISAGVSATELIRLGVEDGISTFILGSDDPRVLEHFAREIVPAVREGIENDRAKRGMTSGGRIRSEASLALRKPGIAYADVPASLVDRSVEPGDIAYTRYRSSYLRGGAPGLVLRPTTVDEVRDALVYAGRHRNVPLGILSAGHGISGRSLNEGGLVIDVSAFNEVEILDANSGRVRIGPGARWIDVARALSPHGLAISSGDYGGVGVGGLATTAGIGWFARKHGLTIDYLRAVDVVLANGTLARASSHENADLFWAMRGAGPNFGIAVAFEFDAARVGDVAFAQLTFDASDTARFLQRWGDYVETAHRSVSGEAILGAARQGVVRTATVMLVVDTDQPKEVVERLQPVSLVAPLLEQNISITSYADVIGAFVDDRPQRGQGEPLSRAGHLEHLTPEFAEAATALLDAGAFHVLQIRAVGGAVADIPRDETAYAWRSANFSVAAFGSHSTRLNEHWDTLIPHFEGMYLSFESSTPPPVERAFPPDHLQRLRQLKRRYDPTGLFRDNFFIEPAAI